MRARRAVFAALAAAAGLLLWLTFAVGDPEAVDVEIEEAPAVVAELEEEDPELDPPPFLEVDEDETARTFIPGEPIAPPESAATGIPEPSPDAAPVRGLLRDAGTGEPLPLYALRIQGSTGPWEDVMTDETGRFTTGSPMAGSTIRITRFDDPSHRMNHGVIAVERRVEEGSAPDLEISVACGPTYRLAISPSNAVEPTTLLANLRIRNPDDSRNIGPWAVRAGEPPWVRFPPVPAEFDRCDRIEVWDKEGVWRGSAKVSTLAGVAPGLVDVLLDPGAVLVGKVVDVEGRPIPFPRVVLDGVAASGKTYDRKVSGQQDGGFRFEFLPEGSASITVSRLRYIEQNETVRLVPGAVTQQDFILVSPPPAGAIRGRLESMTGRSEMDVDVSLRSLSGNSNSAKAKVIWEEATGRRIGVFEFEALPAGEYEVSVRTKDWFTLNPPKRVVSPPAEGLRFILQDDVAHADFAFRARHAGTGADLDTFAWTSLAGTQTGPKRLKFDETFLRRFPLERGFRWRLDRQGFQPLFGDEKAFAVEELREGAPRKIAEVELTPGWGEVFRVVRRGNKKPIAGAKILLDGREAGKTKADGTCFVTALEKPRSVEVDYRDWKVVSPVDLRPSWKRKEKRFVDIEVAAPPKN